MIQRLTVATHLFLAVLASTPSPAQDRTKLSEKDLARPENWPKWDTKPVPVLSPEQSLASIRVAPGFQVQLVASEPMIKDPVFAQFDATGRLWVCEFQTYMLDMNATGENEPKSRVQVLEDTDKDGRMDKATTFADGLINPRALCFLGNGRVLVGQTGEMTLLVDNDGDLQADERTKLLDYATSAFGNIEHAENALLFSLDNWIYNSKSSRRFQWLNDASVVAEARTGGRGQWGLWQDRWGRLYHNSNSRWMGGDWKTYDQDGGIGAPTGEIFTARENTAMNRAYRPNTLRDNNRLRSVTTISGIVCLSDAGWPEDWNDTVFSFSPGGNAVGAFRPKAPMPDRKGYEHFVTGEGEQRREFLTSTDERFRPVNGTVGPDGALYIVDLHRGVIQHKRFLTPFLRTQSAERKLDQPTGLGRIYRVVPDGHQPPEPPKDLVSGLNHPHLWWRMHSQREIVATGRRDLAEAVRTLLTEKRTQPNGLVHALWSLAGLEALEQSDIEHALSHDHWFVQLTGLRIVHELNPFVPQPAPELLPAISRLSESDSLLVASYSTKIAKDGYPDRSGYKDKEAKHVQTDKKLLEVYRAGRVEYAKTCAACHQADGRGRKMVAPALAKSDWVTTETPDLPAKVVLHGLTGPIKVNGKVVSDVPPVMPPHGPLLKDADVAAILTYIRNAWGNKASAVTAAEVARIREANKGRTAMWSAEELDR